MSTMLNNRYEVMRILGSGGFGETFLAKDTNMPSERFCVVKQLKHKEKSQAIHQLIEERFQREAAILEALGDNCTQIPTLYAYFCADDKFYLVQEWIEGDTLTAKFKKQGKFTQQEVTAILVNILPVLDYIHSQHIIHRDIKPDNIIIREHDGKPVLIDFGAVRETMTTVLNTEGNLTSSIVIGTPGFMSSEQAAGRAIYSSDLYSLGLTMVFLLTGKKPQKLETDPHTGEILWQDLVPNLSPNLSKVISKSIAYHPRDRYPSAKAMLDDLQSSDDSLLLTEHSSTITTLISKLPSALISSSKNLQLNTHQTILIGSLITGGLIGISIIISQVIKTASNSLTQSQISISATRTITPIVNNTPTPLNTPLTVPTTTPLNTPLTVPLTISTNTPLASSENTPDNTPENTSENIPENQTLTFKTPDPIINNVNNNPNILPTSTPLNTASVNPKVTPTSEITPDNHITVNNTVNNYAWLSQRPVTDADLIGKNGSELDIMKNSIYAAYGSRFANPELQRYFDQQSWYIPQYSPQNFPMQLLSPLELNNIKYIDQYQLKHSQK